MEKASFLAAQLLTTSVLLLMTSLGLCSAVLPLIIIAFPFLFRTFLLDMLISSELSRGRDYSLYGLAYTVCCVVGTGLPLMLTVQLDMGLMSMFIPLTGRMGSAVPPDVLMGVAMAILMCLHSPHTVCVCVCVCVSVRVTFTPPPFLTVACAYLCVQCQSQAFLWSPSTASIFHLSIISWDWLCPSLLSLTTRQPSTKTPLLNCE